MSSRLPITGGPNRVRVHDERVLQVLDEAGRPDHLDDDGELILGSVEVARTGSSRRGRVSASTVVRRVLMSTDTLGGVWTYALELVRALEPHGIEVVLATMGAPLTDAQRREARTLPNLNVFESDYMLEWMEDPWRDVDRAGEWLQRLASTLRPDVIHLNGYSHAALEFGAPVLLVAHSCVLSWWRAVKGCDAPSRTEPYRARVAAGLAAADMVVAPTRAMLDEVEQLYGVRFRGRVISNGRARDVFSPTAKRRFVFTAGRLWDDAKNLAAVDACARDLPWPVYVAGSSALPGKTKRRAAHVRHLGVLDGARMSKWMGEAAVYLLPARYQPFGLSALEAALSGCALVLGDIRSLREIWGDAACFVSPDDVGAMREAVHALMCDRALRTQLTERALVRAERLSPAAMGSAYVDAYAEIIAASAAARTGAR